MVVFDPSHCTIQP